MAFASSSLLLDSQQPPHNYDDDGAQDPYAMLEDGGGEMADEAEPSTSASQGVATSQLAQHLNPALGAAAALLPHLRWLCACTGIPTAASTSTSDATPAASTVGTPGDANSAVTAVANLEQCVMDSIGSGNAVFVLAILLRGEMTTTAATTPSTSGALSLTQTSSQSSSSSSSGAASGVAVSVPGIMSILRTLVSATRMDPVRSALTALLQMTCQKLTYHLRPYISTLIHLCLFVVRAEKSGRIKEKAMELLGFLLMLVHSHHLDISTQQDYTPPRDIIQQLFNELGVSKSKLTQTMRGSLLSTLGLLSELYEPEFRRTPEYARNLADLYGRTLLEEFESSKEPHRRVIEGCLIGLRHFLMFFSDYYRTNHQQKVLRLENIYKTVRTSLSNMQDSRYDILLAGLQCFSRHAALFREFITAPTPPGAPTPAASSAAGATPPPTETEMLFSILLQGSKHQNIKVSTRSNYALEAFLQQVASYLIDTTPAPATKQSAAAAAASSAASSSSSPPSYPAHKRKLFNLLLSVFVKKLDSVSKSVAEVSLAVRALGQLARVIVVYLNAGELRKILNKLLENSEKLFRSQTSEEVDKAVSHFPDFLAAFAFIIRYLPDCDMAVLDSLITMLRRFFLAYPTFTTSQRSKNMVSLTRLFVVLYDKGIIFQHLLEKTIFSGLVLTISALPQLTTLQFFMTGKQTERHAYVEYCYLWHNLLGVAIRQDEKGDKSILSWNEGLDYLDESIVWRMRKVLFDQIMSDVLKCLKTLDLSLTHVTGEGEDSSASGSSAGSVQTNTTVTASALSKVGDPSSTLQPSNAKDVELFLNLNEFLQRFFFPPYGALNNNPLKEERLTLNHYVSGKTKLSELILPSHITNSSTAASSFLTRWFLGWISLFVPDLIELSNKYPLISGYYKLITLVGKIQEQYHYFDDVDTKKTVKIEEIKEDEDGDEKMDDAAAASSAGRRTRVKREGQVKMEEEEEVKSQSLELKQKKKAPLDTLANRSFVFQLMSGFLASVLVRLGQFTDELLYSSIHLVLNVPLQFVDLDRWVPALLKSIEIGKNYRPAAYLSIDVLNKWHDVRSGAADSLTSGSNIRVSAIELTKYFPQILPHFNDYLRIPKNDIVVSSEEKKSGSKSSKKSKSSTSSAIMTTTASSTVENMEFELVRRILEFLGKVGGNNKWILGAGGHGNDGDASHAAPGSESESKAVNWEATQSIKYALPLSQKLDVTLDQLLPHLTHLAEFSPERKVQVAACEALHSLVIFMISTTARDPNRTHALATGNKEAIEESSFLSLYVKLFPILLRLATSVETVTKQLFHPLIFQITHWFTNTNTTLFKDSRALLDAVTDAVGNEHNGALREYAADVLAEFFKWSMKHGTTQESGKKKTGAAASSASVDEEKDAMPMSSAGAALNTKSLLRRLYSLALHPSPYHRLGAALTFNKLYRIFREYDSLISMHTLDLMDHMLHSLKLAQHDDDALGTKDEVRSAIEALERIITDRDAKKFNLLLKQQPERAGALHCKSLSQFLTHLLESAGLIEDDYRRECLRVYQSCCSVLPAKQLGADRGAKFFQHYVTEEHSITRFIEIVERGSVDDDAAAATRASGTAAAASSSSSSSDRRNEMDPPRWMLDSPGTDDIDSSEIHRWQSLQTWLTRLSSALDVYWWLLREKLLGENMEASSQRLFSSDSGSQLRDALKSFLLLMSGTASGGHNAVEEFVTSYSRSQTSEHAKEQLLQTYSDLKCTVLIRFFRFMQLLSSDASTTSSPLQGALLGKAFYILVFHCLLTPEQMGFPISNLKRIRVLQATIGGLCTNLSKIASKHSIVEVLSTMLKKPELAPSSFQLSSLLHRVGSSSITIEGYKHLWTSGLLSLALGANECSEFAHQLLASAFELHTNFVGREVEHKFTMTPLGAKVSHQMLHLAFHIGVSPERLFNYLTDVSPVEMSIRVKTQPAAAAASSSSSSRSRSPRVKIEDMDVDTVAISVEGTTPSTAMSESSKGSVFYTNFRSLIDSYLTVRFSTFSAHIISRAFMSRDMFALLLNVGEYVLSRRQRKKAVQHAFSAPTPPTDAEMNGASSSTATAETNSSSYSNILSQVNADAEAYVSHVLDGFMDARQTFILARPSILAGGGSSSTASNASAAPVAFNKKSKRKPAAPSDTSKLLQLPADNELASMLLHLFETLILLDSPRVLSQDANPSFGVMMETYCQCLGSDANLPIKKQALTLLPAFFSPNSSPSSAASSSSSSAVFNAYSLLTAPVGMESLVATLRQLIINPPFPQISTDLTIGSTDYLDYTGLLDLLLNAVVLSKNFALLELLLPILREGNSHLYHDQINMHISNYLTTLVDTSIGDRSQQLDQIINHCWMMFQNRVLDLNPKNNVRYWIAQFLLLPLLRISSLSTVRRFFEHQFASIWSIITALPEGPKMSADLTEQELQLQELETAYNLLALMFKRLPEKSDRPKEVDHKEIIKFSHSHLKKCVSRQPDQLSFQNFSTAAFNALASALMATQTDPKFLNVLCFSENLAKGEELWSRIIDVKKIGQLRFEIETNFNTIESTLADMQLLSRPQGAVNNSQTGGEGEVGQANSRYLSSQYLSDSSVSQESSGLFEYQGPIQSLQRFREAEEDEEEKKEESKHDDLDADSSMMEDVVGGTTSVELLDLDPILSIPAVPILLNLVQHMEDKFGAAHREHQLMNDDLTRMPEWMNQLLQKFCATSTHVTIKWCIAKVIVIKHMIFKPYSGQWFIPLVQLMVLPAEVSGGVGFHYFLRDLCSVFLRWKLVPGPDDLDRLHASALISHLMRVAVDHGSSNEGKRSRLRANLLTIKLLIDLWQNRLQIDRSIIHNYLTRDITKARVGSEALTARQIGLQLLAITFEKQFVAYDPVEDRGKLTETSILDALLSTLMSHLKTLYEPAAEVLGIWIKNQATASNAREVDQRRMYAKCLHEVRLALKKLFFQRDYTIFFGVLLKLCLYLGRLDLVNDEILNMLFQIPQQEGEHLHMFLAVLERSSLSVHAPAQHSMYDRMKSTIRRVLRTVDSQSHYLLLNILFRISSELTLDDLRELVPDLTVLFTNHSSSQCRMIYYKILIWIYDNHEEFQKNKKNFIASSQGSSSESHPTSIKARSAAAASSSSSPHASAAAGDIDPLVRMVVVGLLRGLSDPVASVRDHLFAFWDDPQRLPAAIEDRLLYLLTTLWQPETVNTWLSYATRLLMYQMRKSSDWSRPFSGEALANAKFQPMNIDASGYTRSQPMTPLFGGGSQQGVSGQDGDGDFMMDGGGQGMVLNSQAGGGNFQATPSLMSMNSQQLMDFNLSQSSQSEHLYFKGQQVVDSQMMGSYQAFTANTRSRALKKRMKGGQAKQRVNIRTSHLVKVGADTVSLRFAGSMTQGARSDANKWRQKADLENRYKRQWAQRLAEENAGQITMYRRYRKGELPDIEIAHKELLQPLESLHTEADIAKQMFCTIVHAVYTQITRWESVEEVNRYRTELRKAILQVIHALDAQSAASSASLVCALQNAILTCGREDPSFTANWSGVDIKQLGEISYQSKNYHTGIMLLEHVIGTKSEIKLKNMKKHVRDDELSERHEQAYLQLARLYRELGESEIMMNLYATFARQDFTRAAITAMLRGDWQSAMSQYDDALTRFDMVQRHDAEWDGQAPSADEVELWSDERLECLRQLTDWSTLRDNVLVEVDQDPDRLWDDRYCKGPYLAHYLTSTNKVVEHSFLSLSIAAASADPSSLSSSSSSVAASSAAASSSSRDPRTELLQFVERALNHKNESNVLLTHHAPDLVLLYALRGSIEHASTFLKQTYMRFLQQWIDLPQIATGPRLALLQRLQKLTEVSEFLHVEQELASAVITSTKLETKGSAIPTINPASTLLEITSHLHHQLSVWRARLPSKTDTVDSWDDIVLNRSAFLVHLKQSLESRVTSCTPPYTKMLSHVVEDVRREVSQSVSEMYRKAANVMVSQGNTSVADKYVNFAQQLLQTHGIVKSASTSADDIAALRQYDFLHTYTNVKVKLAHMHVTSPAAATTGAHTDRQIKEQQKQRIKSVKTLYQLRKMIWDAAVKLKDDAKLPSNAYRIATLKSEIHEELVELLALDPSLSQHIESKSAGDLFSETVDDLTELTNDFQGHVADSKSSSVKEDARIKIQRQASQAYMTMVQFCDQRLAQAEDHADTCDACKSQSRCTHPLVLKGDVQSHLIEALVNNVLAAMQLGSRDARGFFPRALELVSTIDAKSPARDKFVRDTQQIPSWMFIQWIPQLLSVITLPQGSLAFPILVRIASEYPQSIYYPFNLTRESVRSNIAPGAPKISSATDKYLRVIGSHLQHKLIAQFIDCLDYLAVPELKLKDTLRTMHRLIGAHDQKAAQKKWMEFRMRHFSSNGTSVSKCMGPVYQAFSNDYKKLVDQYFGYDGALILKMTSSGSDANSWNMVYKLLTGKIDKSPGSSKDVGKKPLANFTTWLGQFEKAQAATGEYIELPGQYTGLQKPQPELHVRIVNFDPMTLIMSSLRRPKRLTVNGSDERTRHYLVKGGEDLRMDQRVEQTFTTMNEILLLNAATNRRALSLRTYQVIPLTQDLGMLEWVDNTEPLKSLLLNNNNKLMNEAGAKYNQNLVEDFKQTPGKPVPASHASVYYSYIKNVEKKKVAERFAQVTAMMPSDLIAKAIARLCSTPETFLVFRSNFARSYSTLSMCAYILGIGDRHLENFLVDRTNSDVVGIDFGAAFGQGVLLTVPELMPFRYTRQFQHMLDPLRTEEILKQDMTYVMKALREERRKLLTMMDVFVKEPQMEWIAAGRTTKLSAEMGDDIGGGNKSNDWYPKRKLRVVKSKLEGHNPAKILKIELQENRHVCTDAALYEKCVTILKGEPHTKRAALDAISTPEEQVALLLEMGKDPNILGRTWTGWGSYV